MFTAQKRPASRKRSSSEGGWRREPLVASAALIVSVLALSACSGTTAAPAPEASASAGPVEVFPVEGVSCEPGSKPEGDPIVVGGSLSLTGPLEAGSKVHDLVADVVVDWVNDCGGINGRPMEWRVRDDQSTPAQAATNYERLIEEGVDLVMGPFGTANNLAAAGPVLRANYAFPTFSNGAPGTLIGNVHLPSGQFGNGADHDFFRPQAEKLWGALSSGGNPPKTAFFAASKFPSTVDLADATREYFISQGVEIVGDIQYDVLTTDFSSLALRLQQTDPDFVYLGALGADVNNQYTAFSAIGYEPRVVYASLPAPGAIAALGSEANNLLFGSHFEASSPLAESDIAKSFIALYAEAAKEAGLDPLLESQGASSFSAWQILITGVANAGPDNAALLDYLHANGAKTLLAEFTFDGFNGYSTDTMRVGQVQDGVRKLVWPEDVASAEPIL